MNLPENSHLTLSVLHNHRQIDVWAVIIVNTIRAVIIVNTIRTVIIVNITRAVIIVNTIWAVIIANNIIVSSYLGLLST